MDNFIKTQNIPKIYRITGFIALIFTAILILFTVYNQFIYVDGTWVHGFTANGFAVFSGIVWIGILFIFKRFLNRILNYSRSNLLINAYLIFLAISTLVLGNVVYKSIELYYSLEDSADFSALHAFSTSSISGVIFLFIANYAIILICILLGYRLSRVDILEKKLFQILGYSFITFGIISFLTSITVIENDTFQFIVKAVMALFIGLILKKISDLDTQQVYELTGFEIGKTKQVPEPKVTPKPKITPKAQNQKPKKVKEPKPTKTRLAKSKKQETNLGQEELPSFNLEELDDKELVISYYKNLPTVELNRLENIIDRKYNRVLTKEQKENLVLHYIVEKKMYDHQRFFPK